MAVAWTDVQNALVAWVENTTSLAEGSVVWGFQKEPQPVRPYISLRIIPPRRLGQDALIITTDLTQTGQEIQQTVRGQRELTVVVDSFSNAVIGAGTALEYLQDALTGVYLPSQSSLLFEAGLSYITYEQPVDLTALEAGTSYVSRAQSRVKFALTDIVEESTGYISTIQVTPTIDGTVLPTVTEGPF
jgi:hypothetical protein